MTLGHARRARAALAALLVLAAPASVGAETADAVASVARLNVQGAGVCSAVLVSPDLVVTAAHCLRSPISRRFVAPERLHLLFGYDRGAWRTHRRARSFAADPAFDPAAPVDRAPSSARLEQDLAVVLLEAAVEEPEPAPLAAATPSFGAALTLTGFAAPRREVLGVVRDCPYRARRGAVLVAGCPIAPGASGGGLFDAEGRLLGVAIGGAEVLGQPAALAVAATPERIAALRVRAEAAAAEAPVGAGR